MTHWLHGPCLLCYANARKRANHKGHYGHVKRRFPWCPRPWEKTDMKKPTPQETAAEGAAPAKGDLFQLTPLLWEMMTTDKWEDGSKRERSSLLLVCDGGTAKVWLNDRATGRTAWSSGESIEAALLSLEQAIETNSVPWRRADGKRFKKT